MSEALSRRGGIEVRYVGTPDGLEAKIVPPTGLPFVAIESKPLSRRLSFSVLKTLLAFRKGVQQARGILKAFQPDVVVGFGGYVTGPMVYAAARAGIRTIIHEQNAMPGRANRLLSRWVTKVAVNFEEAARFFPRDKVIVTGMPVRCNLGKMTPAEGRAKLGLATDRVTLLVIGGSRGARSLNNAVLEAAPGLVGRKLQILHQTGAANFDEVKQQADRLALDMYHPVPYIDDVGAAFAAADLAVSRSGASSIAELTMCGVPAILVPYPFAIADHQTYNAKALVNRGAALLVPDKELTGVRLAAEVASLIEDPERIKKMSEAGKSLANPDAAEVLAELVMGGLQLHPLQGEG